MDPYIAVTSSIQYRFVSRLARTLLVALLCGGCQRSEAPREATAAPAEKPKPLPVCTITTELVPGIPGSPGHLIESARNPNGDSELAALMRVMLDDAKLTREQVARGEPVGDLFTTHRKIRCTWPVDPKTRNAHFDSMAKRYLDAVRALERKPDEGRFEDLVTACIACHENTCPGPTSAIEKLRLPGE